MKKPMNGSSWYFPAFLLLITISLSVFLVTCGGGGGGGGGFFFPQTSGSHGSLIWAQTSNPSVSFDPATATAIDASFLYVAGVFGGLDSTDSQWRIEKRSLTDGSLVADFGAGGIITSNPSAGHDGVKAMAIDASSIYVAGFDRSTGSGDYQWRIEKRSLTDGSLVADFGAGGIITSNAAGNDEVTAMAIDASSIYVAGYAGNTDIHWRIEKRSLTDGSLAAAFGAGGVITSNPSAENDEVTAMAIDASSIYVAGYDGSTGGADYSQWRIEKRSLTDGSLAAAFGAGGVVTSNPSTGYDLVQAMAIDASSIYVGLPGLVWVLFSIWEEGCKHLESQILPVPDAVGPTLNHPDLIV